LAKRLKKEKVNVDVINFGEQNVNTDKLTTFVNTINGKDGSSSHLVTVPPGPMLSDALVSSPIVVGEDGSGAVPTGMGFEFGVDPSEDPELALALRVSMEEQRSRQEDEARKAAAQSVAETGGTVSAEDTGEDALLKQALEMSMVQDEESAEPTPAVPDFATMTEEEQIAYAMQMSLTSSAMDDEDTATPMETDDGTKSADTDDKKGEQEEDYSEVMNDPAFLRSVLEGLPGVDPESEAVQNAMGALTKESEKKDDKKKDDKK